MKVILLPNKILRTKSLNVSLPLSQEDKTLCQEMRKYIIDSQKQDSDTENIRAGIGIAAPQVGVNKRVFYVNIPALGDEEAFEELLINPVFVSKSVGKASLKNGEGCLSVEDVADKNQGFVKRNLKVIIKGYSYLLKKQVTISKIGYHAIVLQHEMDHLDGKLFIDRLNHKNPWFEDKNMKII